MAASQIAIMATMLGAIIGIGSSLITALLMLLKNARHSHFFPDFPPGQIGAIIERAPVWALAGGLIGLGLGLLWNALKTGQGQTLE